MQLNTYEQKDYSGGLNNTSSAREIQSTEASLLRNWDITKKGQLIRRNGLTQVGDTTSGTISGLHAYTQTDGDKDILVTEGTNLKYLNSSVFTTIDSGFTAGNDFTFANCPINNRVYLGNQSNTLHYWDRASTSLNICLGDLGADVPHGNVLRWHKNHMFTLNNATVTGVAYPNRLYWSAIGDPNTWDTTSDFIDMPGNGRLITAMDLGDSLILFKEQGIQYLEGWGDSDWRITASASNVANISEQVGCLSPKGITRVGNEVWFMDDEGFIRRVNRTDFDAFRTDYICTKIMGTIETINTTYLEKVVAWSHNNKVYFAVPTGSNTVNDTVLVYDITASKRTGEEAWTTYTGWSPDFFISYPENDAYELYLADSAGKKVYQHDGDDDDGTAIDARWDSKEDGYGYPERIKRYRFGYITGEGSADSTIGIYASLDGGAFAKMDDLVITSTGSRLGTTGTDTLAPTGNFTLGSEKTTELTFYPSDSGVMPTGKTYKTSIRHNEVNKTPVVNSYTVHYKLRNLR